MKIDDRKVVWFSIVVKMAQGSSPFPEDEVSSPWKCVTSSGAMLVAGIMVAFVGVCKKTVWTERADQEVKPLVLFCFC